MQDETQTALAERRLVVEARLAQQAAQRSLRRQTPGAYPTTLPYDLLMPRQRAERRELARDIEAVIQGYLRSPLLSDRQRRILFDLVSRLSVTRGAYAMSHRDWEAFWSVRDFLQQP